MKLHQWIKAARESANLTQDQLGERLDRTKAMVSHWETGKNEPAYSTLLKIAQTTNYFKPLPGSEDFIQSADWPIEGISKSEYECLGDRAKEDVASFIRWKIDEEKRAISVKVED